MSINQASHTNPRLVFTNGRNYWDFGDRILPVVSGGSDDGGGQGGDGSGGGDGGNTGDGGGTGGGTGDQLGEGGMKALEAERRARSEFEKRATAAERALEEKEAKLREFEEQSKTQAEKDRDKAIKETEERVRNEVLASTNGRLVKSEIRIAAATKLQDPEDAVRYLDLDSFKVGDDGEVDKKAIASAIDALVKEKPYLAANATKVKGDADQGSRTGGKDDKVAPGTGRMASAYANSGKKK